MYREEAFSPGGLALRDVSKIGKPLKRFSHYERRAPSKTRNRLRRREAIPRLLVQAVGKRDQHGYFSTVSEVAIKNLGDALKAHESPHLAAIFATFER